MNTYLAIVWKSSEHPSVESSTFLPYLLKKPDKIDSWHSPSGHVDLYSFANWPELVLPKCYLLKKETSALTFEGFPDTGLDLTAATAKEFEDNLVRTAGEDIRRVEGEFSLVVADDRSITAYLNPNGSHHLFYVDEPGYIAFSNRLPLLLQLPGISRDLDPLALQWLCYQGFTQQGVTAFKAVRKLIPGDRATATREMRLRVQHQTYAELVAEQKRDFSPEELPAIFREHCRQLANYVRRMHAFYGRAGITLRLSGGKDSRVVLSLLMHAGLGDAIDNAYTSGPFYAPDVLSAQDIIKKVGLQDRYRVVRQSAYKEAMDLDTRLIVESLNVTAGQLSVHDFCRIPGFSSKILVTGHQGLRDAWFRYCPTGSMKQFTDAVFATYFHDPLGLMEEKTRNAFKEQYARLFEDFHVKEKAPIDAVAELHAYREVQGAWGAAINLATQQSAPMCSPLLHPSVCSLTLAMPKSCRYNEMYHFMSVATMAPELLDVPFCNQQWSAELATILDGVMKVPNVAPYRSNPNFPALSNMFLPPLKIALYNSLKPYMASLAEKHADFLQPHLSMERVRQAMQVNRDLLQPEMLCGMGLYTILLLAEFGLDLFHQEKGEAIIESTNGIIKERHIVADPNESMETRYENIIEKYEKGIAGLTRDIQKLEVPAPHMPAKVAAAHLPWYHIHIRNENAKATDFYLIISKGWKGLGNRRKTRKHVIPCGDTFTWGVQVEAGTKVELRCDAIKFSHTLQIRQTILSYHVLVE